MSNKNKVCIICGKSVDVGYVVKDDIILQSIRKVKNALRIAKNNVLMVHEGCLSEYKNKRKQFEKRMLFASLFAILFIIGLNAMQFFAGVFSLMVLASSLLLSVFPFILVVLTSYCPSIIETDSKGVDISGKEKGK